MILQYLSRCCPTTADVVVHVVLPLSVLFFAFFLLLLFVHLVSFAPVSLLPPIFLCIPLLILMFVLLLLLLFVWSQVDLALLLLDRVAANLGLIPKAIVEELGADVHLSLIPKAAVEELGAYAHLGFIPKAVVEELGVAHLGLIPKGARAHHRHPHPHHQHRDVVVVAHLGVEAK
jgi:hypothetical protein